MILRPPRSTLFPYTNALPIFLELDPRDDEDFDEELKRQTTVLGEVFDKQDEAKDRKSTRLNSSHVAISYAVFCLKKKKRQSDLWELYTVSATQEHVDRQ